MALATVIRWKRKGISVVEKEPLYQDIRGFIFAKVDTPVLFSPLSISNPISCCPIIFNNIIGYIDYSHMFLDYINLC